MVKIALPTGPLRFLTRDGYLLFLTRFMRLLAYGSLSVVLVFYLIGLGLSASQIGLLLTLTLLGDTVISLFLTTRADRIGRRRMLIVGAALMTAAGIALCLYKQCGAADRSRHNRSDQPQRQRSRSVSVN